MEAGFDSDIGGDVPDWDNTESRESDEDAAWRDLVARFDEPIISTGAVPWPERENVPAPRPLSADGTGGTRGQDVPDGAAGIGGNEDAAAPGRTYDDADAASSADTDGDADTAAAPRGADGGPDAGEGIGFAGARGVDKARGSDAEEIRGPAGGASIPEALDPERTSRVLDPGGRPGPSEPDLIQAPRRQRGTPAHGTRSRRIRARKPPPRPEPADDEGHYIPPAPPPLPKLDPVTKGAWAALFGGPGYLIIATAVGWPVPGIAAFFAVAAFVTGFVILVLRMNEPGPGGPDNGDDGAVV